MVEIVGMRLHAAAKRVGALERVGQRTHTVACGKQALGDVPARIAVCAGYDVQFLLCHRVAHLSFSPAAQGSPPAGSFWPQGQLCRWDVRGCAGSQVFT